MTGTFRAIRASKGEKAPQVEFANLTEADLMEGDVTVAVDYSTVNYKDGLALTGAAVGMVTDQLALNLIFLPVEPKRIGPLTLQGLFLRRQAQVSAEFSEFVVAFSKWVVSDEEIDMMKDA